MSRSTCRYRRPSRSRATPKPIFLTLKADHSLALGETPVPTSELSAALDAASGNDKDQRIFLRADKQVEYGALMELMNRLRAAGYLKVALVGLEAREALRSAMTEAQ